MKIILVCVFIYFDLNDIDVDTSQNSHKYLGSAVIPGRHIVQVFAASN